MPETTDWLPDWLGDWAIDWLAAAPAAASFPRLSGKLPQTARQLRPDKCSATLTGTRCQPTPAPRSGCNSESEPVWLLAAIFHCCYWPRHFHFARAASSRTVAAGFSIFPFLFDFLGAAFSCTNKNRIEIENCFSHTHTHIELAVHLLLMIYCLHDWHLLGTGTGTGSETGAKAGAGTPTWHSALATDAAKLSAKRKLWFFFSTWEGQPIKVFVQWFDHLIMCECLPVTVCVCV